MGAPLRGERVSGLFSELKRRNVFRVVVLYIVVAWLLLQVTDVVVPGLGLPAWSFKLVLVLLALGFPVVVVFSWVFELTPAGLKRERDISHDHSITASTGRKLDYVTIAVVILAAIFVAYQRYGPQPTARVSINPKAPATAEAVPEVSLAVLPFVNMSQDPDNEYFSDGMSEELLNLLVKIKGMRVPSRTSSFAFKDKELPLKEIAQKLDVDHVLEGSVRKSGEHVRITAQLIDVRTDSHLWSETYDRDLKDIFKIQDEIASHIVAALKDLLAPGAATAAVASRPPTDNVEAYQLFLRGQHYLRLRGSENLRRAADLFTQAFELDPAFARAEAGLALTGYLIPVYESGADQDLWHERARAAADKAMALDPSLADPHSVLAAIEGDKWEFAAALRNLERALELEPDNANVNQWYGEQLNTVGRISEGAHYLQRARDLDPLSPVANNSLAQTYLLEGRYEKALEQVRTARELGYVACQNAGLSTLALVGSGRFQDALDGLERTPDWPEEDFQVQIHGLKLLIDPQDASALAYLTGPTRDFDDSYACGFSAYVYLSLAGRVDEAFAILGPLSERKALFTATLFMPSLAALRRDPRFLDVAKKTGLLQYWRENAWPDMCRADSGGEGLECD